MVAGMAALAASSFLGKNHTTYDGRAGQFTSVGCAGSVRTAALNQPCLCGARLEGVRNVNIPHPGPKAREKRIVNERS